MSERPLGFALVGCGRIAKRHAELLSQSQISGARLVACCDIDEDRASLFGTRYNVPTFIDMHDMMKEKNTEIDVVVILTESGKHASHTLQLAPYKKHIVVEKPMALTLKDADTMIQRCDEHSIKLFVVKQNRYNYPVQKLRQALDEGRLGKITMGTVRVRWSRDQNYYDLAPWRGTWAMDGGVFANQASHHIDLLEWMLGDPESVFAKSRQALVDIETEDTGVALIKFRSGALGVVEATTATRPKDLEGSLSVLGEKGSVEIGGFAVNEMRTWNLVDSTTEDDDVVDKYRQNPPNVYGFGHRAYLQHVVQAIRNNSPALVDGLEGRKSLELITAIYESIETGQEISLRFNPKKCRLGLPKK
jgi:UDP-N-acetyl-2-amino-2-deoxyglucuronate dehydrogenase